MKLNQLNLKITPNEKALLVTYYNEWHPLLADATPWALSPLGIKPHRALVLMADIAGLLPAYTEALGEIGGLTFLQSIRSLAAHFPLPPIKLHRIKKPVLAAHFCVLYQINSLTDKQLSLEFALTFQRLR